MLYRDLTKLLVLSGDASYVGDKGSFEQEDKCVPTSVRSSVVHVLIFYLKYLIISLFFIIYISSLWNARGASDSVKRKFI